MPQAYKGLDGSLMRSGRHGIIGYRRDIPEPGRIAFTIAHELGHWELHPNHSQAIACTAGDIAAYKGTGIEQEANAFAAELLMPTPMLAQSLRYASATIQKAAEVASTYGTSLTAAVIRVVELIDSHRHGRFVRG
jgi:Zn-dependent peptidase ImmA (M78 family)